MRAPSLGDPQRFSTRRSPSWAIFPMMAPEDLSHVIDSVLTLVRENRR